MTSRSFLSSLVLSFVLAAPSSFAADASVPDSGKSSDSGTRADATVPGRDASAVDSGLTEAGSSSEAAAPPTAIVGGTCTKDAQCDSGLTCLVSTSTALGGGGPASGLCTLDCAKGGQAACDAIDPGSICRPLDATGKVAYCFERCIAGAGSDAQKCHQRPDMACAPSSNNGDFYCAPTCRGDFDCESRKCDPLSGLCVDKVLGTLPLGAACQEPPDGGTLPAAELCKGVCQSTAPAIPSPLNSACTSPCSLGVIGACDQDPNPNSTRRPTAGCVPLDSAETMGDLGVCVQLCDCDSDCLNKSFWCAGLAPAAVAALGRPGTCVTAGSVDTTLHLACTTSKPDSGTKPTGAGGKSGTSDTDAGSSTGGGAAAAPAKNDSGCGCHVGRTEPRRNAGFGAGALLMLSALFARRLKGRHPGRAKKRAR